MPKVTPVAVSLSPGDSVASLPPGEESQPVATKSAHEGVAAEGNAADIVRGPFAARLRDAGGRHDGT